MPERLSVSCNLELQSLSEALLEAGLDPDAPTIFVLEGVTMYLKADVNDRVIGEISALARNADSRLSVYYVDASILRALTGRIEIDRFMAGMQSIGEPFVWGIIKEYEYFSQFGLVPERLVSSDR